MNTEQVIDTLYASLGKDWSITRDEIDCGEVITLESTRFARTPQAVLEAGTRALQDLGKVEHKLRIARAWKDQDGNVFRFILHDDTGETLGNQEFVVDAEHRRKFYGGIYK